MTNIQRYITKMVCPGINGHPFEDFTYSFIANEREREKRMCEFLMSITVVVHPTNENYTFVSMSVFFSSYVLYSND